MEHYGVEIMGKAKIVGYQKSYIPNNRAGSYDKKRARKDESKRAEILIFAAKMKKGR